MSAHTPGVWAAQKDPNSLNPDDYVVGVSGFAFDGVAVCSKQDAALIASAPLLLESLQSCERWFVKHSPTSPLINSLGEAEHPMLSMIRAAIAKAQGES